MLFDGFDIYIAGTVLGAKLKSGLHFQKGAGCRSPAVGTPDDAGMRRPVPDSRLFSRTTFQNWAGLA
jgi:hypothetical protein